MASNFNRFYEQELANLRTLATEFSKANPAIAPMLSSSSNDPDVERLLEGVAFLNGLTLQKIDDQLPEIAQNLNQLLFPQILQPIPAATIMAFTPKSGMRELAVIKAGTEIASIEVDGTSSIFRTIAELFVPPMSLESVISEVASDGGKSIKLTFVGASDDGTPPVPSNVSLFLGDDYPIAAYLFMLLMNHTISIRMSDDMGSVVTVPHRLTAPAFDQALIVCPINSLPSLRLIQEYFFMPEKFLFVQLPDLSQYHEKFTGRRLHVEICFDTSKNVQIELTANSFLMNVVPAVNLFKHSAEPIRLDHKSHSYRVLPEGKTKDHYQVFSVDQVVGYRQGEPEPQIYETFIKMGNRHDESVNLYRITLKPSVLSDDIDTYLSVIYKSTQLPVDETLSIDLTCTNNALPNSLLIGDVSRPTSSSPERFTYTNIRPVVPKVDPEAGEHLVWSSVANLSLNFLTLSSVENLKSLLGNYNCSTSTDHAAKAANERRINGLIDMTATRESRVSEGALVHGQHIKITCTLNNFAGLGDLYLFGSVLEHFLASYSGINSYTRLEIFDTISGTTFTWPMRLGNRPLL